MLRHRGPDETTRWIDPQGRAVFGYARLGLVGLSNGTQPIIAPEGDVVMMVNGEFYEFEKIREELVAKGYKFQTGSDSEIFLHLYREHGLGEIKYLRGEFSILLFDRKRNMLIAIRDRLGIKPFYHAYHGGVWYFASEIKAISATGVPAVWDENSCTNRAFIPGDHSLFRGIRSVQPGHWMVIDGSGNRAARYWDFNFSSGLRKNARFDEQRQSWKFGLPLKMLCGFACGQM